MTSLSVFQQGQVFSQHSVPNSEQISPFLVPQGDLVISLITSDYARLGWCQARAKMNEKVLLGT